MQRFAAGNKRSRGAQRRYAIANPQHWQGYGRNVWGMSASDGPGPATEPYLGKEASFLRYAARGVGVARIVDDGTLAPTAAISSLPFAPEIVVPATLEMYRRFGVSIYSSYGFLDAFNPSFPVSTEQSRGVKGAGWVDPDYVGIDAGTDPRDDRELSERAHLARHARRSVPAPGLGACRVLGRLARGSPTIDISRSLVPLRELGCPLRPERQTHHKHSQDTTTSNAAVETAAAIRASA